MKRISISLPDKAADELERWALEEHRSMSNLAATLLLQTIASERGVNYMPADVPYRSPRSSKLEG
ncbi:MAG: ribbon-helix-helix protein, CopG family [Geitlerinemataceae cyanobacterium]